MFIYWVLTVVAPTNKMRQTIIFTVNETILFMELKMQHRSIWFKNYLVLDLFQVPICSSPPLPPILSLQLTTTSFKYFVSCLKLITYFYDSSENKFFCSIEFQDIGPVSIKVLPQKMRNFLKLKQKQFYNFQSILSRKYFNR